MIIGDTKEVVRNHYTRDNEDMIKEAMDKMSEELLKKADSVNEIEISI